ncbi:unnamed protein product [Euphydryas editha]|uniref:Uncharacterized protein n=1 Tax=Euphydryas editha TaxID=104508 RepID=A0AAU9VAT2_EUPED|nr:unnamed protein product [Euphydryas editha]
MLLYFLYDTMVTKKKAKICKEYILLIKICRALNYNGTFVQASETTANSSFLELKRLQQTLDMKDKRIERFHLRPQCVGSHKPATVSELLNNKHETDTGKSNPSAGFVTECGLFSSLLHNMTVTLGAQMLAANTQCRFNPWATSYIVNLRENNRTSVIYNEDASDITYSY